MPPRLTELEIGDGAADELWRHGLLRRHPVEVLARRPRILRNRSGRTGDWLMIGPDFSGRLLTIVLAEPDDEGTSQVITGWRASRAERSRYRQAR